jgi:hypothetical protein
VSHALQLSHVVSIVKRVSSLGENMSSQVCFHDKYVNISDDDVVLLLHMVMGSLGTDEADDWSRRARHTWERTIAGCGFGLYEMNLEKLVTNDQEKQRMLHLFERARNAINVQGPHFTKEWLSNVNC